MAKKELAEKEIATVKRTDSEILLSYEEAVKALNEPFVYGDDPVNEREWADKKAALIACDASSKPIPHFYGNIDVPQLRSEIAAFEAAKMAHDARVERAKVELEGGLAMEAFCAESRLSIERIPAADSNEQAEFPSFVTRLEYVSPTQITPEMFEEHDVLTTRFDQLLQDADAVILKNDARRSNLSAKAVTDETLTSKLNALKEKREDMVLKGQDASVLNEQMLELERAIRRDEMNVRCASLDVDVLNRQRVNLQARRDLIQQMRDEISHRKAALVACNLTEQIFPLTVKIKQLFQEYDIAKHEAGNGYFIPGIESQIDLGRVLEREEPYLTAQEETAPAETEAQPDGEHVEKVEADGKVVITKGRSRWQIG